MWGYLASLEEKEEAFVYGHSSQEKVSLFGGGTVVQPSDFFVLLSKSMNTGNFSSGGAAFRTVTRL